MFKNIFDFKASVYRIILISISISFYTALLTYKFEKNALNSELQTTSDLIYFWVGIMTTVGHGFSNLITNEGKILASITMVFGTFFYFALFSEIILAIKDRYDARFKGIKRYKGDNHVVIVGYNNLTLGLVHLLDKILKSNVDIILVASRIENNPDIQRVRFIHDNPATPTALERSKITSAKIAFIMSNDEISEDRVDLNSILVGSMIEEMNNSIYTVVELNFSRKAKEVRDFNINATITFEQLLDATKDADNKLAIFEKFPKELRESLFKEEFL